MDVQALGKIEADGFEKGSGFQALADGDDLLEGGVGRYGRAGLGDDGTFIQAHADEMGGDADEFNAVFIGLAIGLGAGETGEKRGVNVDDLVFVAPDEIGRENFHEAGQDDEIRLVLLDQFQRLRFRRRPVFPGNENIRQLVLARQPRQVAPVGKEDGRIGPEPA